MWANAREELRRPGLSGGGGGKPLFTGTGLGGTAGAEAVGGVANGAAFLLAAKSTSLVLTDLAGALVTGLATGLAATLAAVLTTTLGATLGAGLDADFGGCLGEALAEGLAAAFNGAFTSALALTDGALATGLEADFFKTGLALTTGLATFLATGLATALGAGLALAAAFMAVLTTGLLATTLAAFFAVDADLLVA